MSFRRFPPPDPRLVEKLKWLLFGRLSIAVLGIFAILLSKAGIWKFPLGDETFVDADAVHDRVRRHVDHREYPVPRIGLDLLADLEPVHVRQLHVQDDQIDLETAHPEFRAWKWIEPAELPALIVPFKRELYARLLVVFAEHLG